MTVTNVWVGRVTPTGARVRAKVTGTSTRLAVSTAPDLTGAAFFGPVTPVDNVATLDATGLTEATQYYYAIEDDGTLDATFRGRFRTFPAVDEPADFYFAAIGDAGLSPVTPGTGAVLASTRMSNHAQFETVRQLDPDLLIHCGDMHYYDLGSGSHGIVGGGSLTNYRRAYDDVLLQPNQHRLYREVPFAYVWDDHDFGPNNSDRTHVDRANARTVYQERVPHYPLPAGSGNVPIYQSFQVGRVLFILSDVRSERDPDSTAKGPTKTMLGTTQKAWMADLLATTTAEALIWVNPGQWMDDDSDDTWFSFAHERDELTQMFGDLGWSRRMCVIGADTHALCVDTGKGNRFGHFPVFQVASIDATPSALSGIYDTGINFPTRDARGEFRIVDRGHVIEVEGTTWTGADTLFRGHTWQAVVGHPVFALDYAAGHLSPPLEPVDDDQPLRNDVTAARSGGGSTRVVEESGPLGTATVGQYDEEVTVNVATDDQLPDQAGWRVRLGTVDQARVPQIRVDLTANPGLVPTLVEVETGDKVTVDNPPAWLPPASLEMLVGGYVERVDSYSWDVTFNAEPAEPWTIGQVVATPPAAGPDQPNRLDTTGSSLQTDITAEATSFLVRTPQTGNSERVVWITSDGPAPTGA